MAEANPFGSMASDLFGGMFSNIIFFGIGLILVVAIGGTAYYFAIYRKKFDIDIKVTSERAADKSRVFFDKAAILKDRKTGIKYLRVWGIKKDLPMPKFNIMQSVGKGRGSVDYLEIYRTSEDKFYFLEPSRIIKTKLVKANGELYNIAEQESVQVDTDMNWWNIKRKKDNKTMFDTDSMLMKLIPYIPQIMGGALTIFTIYILMDHLPSILSELRGLISESNARCAAQVTTHGLNWVLLK